MAASQHDKRGERRRWLNFSEAFKRSSKGNLWRIHEGKTLSVFERQEGLHAWCIADGDEPRFSTGNFEDEADALWALWEAVKEGSA